MTGLEEAIRSVVVEVIAEEIAAVEQRILAQLPMQFDQTLMFMKLHLISASQKS